MATENRKTERRSHPRFQISIPCWCEGKERTVLSSFTDISRGGFFIKTADPFPLKEVISISFKLKQYGSVTVTAEVLWHSKGKVGVKRMGKTGMGCRLVEVKEGKETFEKFLNHLEGEVKNAAPSQ